MTDVIDAIMKRASEPRLVAPAPDRQVLQKVFECAARAPDHALLRPWRYLVIEGEGRTKLGELFAQAAGDEEEGLPGKQEKLRKSPLRAPMIIVGIVCHKPHPKVPDIEQHASAAVGLGYMLLALQSAGFGAMWRTGAVAYHPQVASGLGLAENESVAGFLYVGTVDSHKPEVPRPDTADFVSRWPK
ncbi:nitroreductase family protein [Marinobacter changyiensis]|uniref:nitroreductase family protein n=1 Tax=Marinobacter changyiensis TaxID=2604091 RepID=UPI001264032A|nr:nitroreductase [Marinobacter changyiensis]